MFSLSGPIDYDDHERIYRFAKQISNSKWEIIGPGKYTRRNIINQMHLISAQKMPTTMVEKFRLLSLLLTDYTISQKTYARLIINSLPGWKDLIEIIFDWERSNFLEILVKIFLWTEPDVQLEIYLNFFPKPFFHFYPLINEKTDNIEKIKKEEQLKTCLTNLILRLNEERKDFEYNFQNLVIVTITMNDIVISNQKH